jgi:hypothetical protein
MAITEPKVLAVAADHELIRHASILPETLGDFQHPALPQSTPGYWYDSYLPSHTRAGRVIERGPVVRRQEEYLVLISTGEIVSLFPSPVTRYFTRPDMAFLPVPNMSALRYALIWHTESENDPIRALARTVEDLDLSAHQT